MDVTIKNKFGDRPVFHRLGVEYVRVGEHDILLYVDDTLMYKFPLTHFSFVSVRCE